MLQMNMEKDLRLSSILIRWYNENKRDLPWRDTTDPYIIWLSEVILQQTRVAQGYSYFNKFIQKYPSVDLLAGADENEVLKLWQGLGYYSRARNLHAAAKTIVKDYKGIFPEEYKEVLKLKGVGEYTAAAVVSLAYNKPYAVVDGNVYRVLARIFAIAEPIDSAGGKKIFAVLARELLDDTNAGSHNQAMMEFGALQCVPVSPKCDICPASGICLAHAQKKVTDYPKKEGKQKIKNRYFNYFDIHVGDNMFLHQRKKKDIWQNLYELPLIETQKDLPVEELKDTEPFRKLFESAVNVKIRYVKQIKHILSHQIISAIFYMVEVADIQLDNDYLKIKRSDVEDYPVSRLVHKYIEQF
jgi:A/G-specific adenine glycosylase